MKKLLLTFALAGIVSAGATFKACAYCALAYNPATGEPGWAWNCDTLEVAKAKALAECHGGRIEFTNAARGFYAVVRSRDGKGNTVIAWAPAANTPSEAYGLADKWCLDHGRTVVAHLGYWQETVGSP
jgi:Domain of unknown function (DUF4189)